MKGSVLEELRNDILGEDACVRTPFGERRVTYADHIASGRPLASVEERLQRSVLPLYANTHTEDSATGAHTTHLMHEATEYIKARLGADERYRLVFAGSGTTGAIKRMQEILGLAVPSSLRDRVLAVLAPDERPVVFVGPYEHHSNELSWRESLAEVVTIPLDGRGTIDLDALRRALEDARFEGRPKIGSFSAASNVTGIVTDVRAVARLLHEHGAAAFFDFAASAPYVAIDVRPGQPDGIDALFLSPHKFLGGPGSPGLLLFDQMLYDQPAPTTAGGGTVSYVSHGGHWFVEDIEAREDAGTPAILQKLRAAMAFEVKERIGVERIEERERAFITEAIARLRDHPNLQLLGNLEVPRLAVLSFEVRSGDRILHPRFVTRLLNDLFGIQGRAGCSCAGPYGHDLLGIDAERSRAYHEAIEAGFEGVRPGWSRISFHYGISEEAFRFLLEAVTFVAEYGDRFVPLYRFDWRTGAWTHEADEALPCGFDSASWPAVPRSEAPFVEDYRRYLEEARRLAEGLQPPARPGSAPKGLDPSLVTFLTS
ncbi:MAG: aminotransferase class V-fold PLP-dependent enzyme [Deinococcales bacterium]